MKKFMKDYIKFKEICMDMNKYSELTTSDSKILEFYKLYLKRKNDKGSKSE